MRQLVLGLMVVFGCAPRVSQPTEARPVPSKSTPSAEASAPPLEAVRLGTVPAGTSGPYLGLGRAGGVVVWDQPETAELGGWRVLPVDSHGGSRGHVLRVADAPPRLGFVAIRPAGSGFLVASSEHRGETAVIQAMQIAESGQLLGGPTLLEERAASVLWIEALPTQRGTLVLWAKRKDKTAELDAMPLGALADRAGGPQVVAKNVLAWQAIGGSGPAAAWVAVVTADRPQTGAVSLLGLDPSGIVLGSPLRVSSSPTANPDLDLARIGDRLLAAWSDLKDGEPRTYMASLDLQGAVRTEARPATGSTDEESLVRVVGPLGGGPGYLCWEDLTDRPDHGRSIRVAPVSAKAELGAPRVEIEMAETDRLPEFAATGSGLAALTWAPACRRGAACDTQQVWPAFVEFDRELRIVASEPMRLDALSGKPAGAAWGLTCAAKGCLGLAAVPTSPAPVFAVKLTARSHAWKPAAGPVPPNLPPRVKAIDTLSILDPLSGVAAVRTSSGSLAAWVTYFDPSAPIARLKKPAPDGKLEGVRALLQVEAFPEAGSVSSPIQTISYRARSLGRVALAPGEAARDEALLAWSALDYQEPEVFLTLLGANGKKTTQRVLTHNRAPVSDLTVAPVADGWIVGFIDERKGECEVLAAKVDRRLGRVGPERRLAAFKGAATGLRLLVRDQRTYAVWADARNPKRPGWADIYGVVLNSSDASPLGEARALEVTPPHSFFPVLGSTEDGIVLGWIEQTGEDQPEGARVELVRLDSEGQPLSTPLAVSTSGGTPTSLDLACSGKTCKVVVAVDQGARGALEAFVYDGTTPPSPKRLTLLGGPGGQSVALALVGEQLFYSDLNGEGRGRVRRMLIDW